MAVAMSWVLTKGDFGENVEYWDTMKVVGSDLMHLVS
jgi:hypothetical protein